MYKKTLFESLGHPLVHPEFLFKNLIAELYSHCTTIEP